MTAASEQHAQSSDQQQRALRKTAVHFCNEWCIVAVRQKDLRVSAATISQQWEREFVLTRKVCCSVLQCVAVCCSKLQCVAVCCSVLQCVAVWCSVIQYAAVGVQA